MPRLIVQLPGFNGVTVGSLATSNVPVGPTYDAFKLILTKDGNLVTLANLGTDVDEIRVVADTNVIRRYEPALLLSLIQQKSLSNSLVNGAAAAVASAIIPFMDTSRPTVEGAEATSLGTVGIKNLTIEVKLKNPGAVVYALSAVAIQRNVPKQFGFIETHTIDTIDIVNGTKIVNTISTADDFFGLILQSAAITKVIVKVDQNTAFEYTKGDIESLLRLHKLGELTANYFPVAFDYTGQLTDVLPMAARDAAGKVTARVSDFSLEITATAAATIKVLRRNLWRG